jgi:hypothetical protein
VPLRATAFYQAPSRYPLVLSGLLSEDSSALSSGRRRLWPQRVM